MGQKRILVYTESFLPSIGGLENNTLLLCDTLHKLGYPITLLTPQKNAEQQNHFKVVNPSSFFSFFKAVKSHDLILVNGGVSFKIIIPCLLCFKSYLIIYQMASLWENTNHSLFLVKFINILRYLLAKMAKLNIGVSHYSFEVLKKNFSIKKSALLANPADPIFKPQKHTKKTLSKPFICLMAGRIIAGKGVHLLNKAVIELNEEGYHIHLHLIGDGSEKAIIASKFHSNIFLHEAMGKQALADWIKKAHLTIIPSTTHVEGSPLIMAESLILGTPVLVSSQPAMAHSIQHASLIFESGDVSSLKAQIIQLMDENHYGEIMKHCALIANDFSYHRYVESLQNIIAHV